jgi:hypothetical protein
MKKLKIMLLSFALLAVVGTTLAFKARLSNKLYCTAPSNVNGQNGLCTVTTILDPRFGLPMLCPTLLASTTVIKAGQTQIWCMTSAQDLDGEGLLDDCQDALGGNTLPCYDVTTFYPN